MIEQKVLCFESEYDANKEIQRLNNQGWKVVQISGSRSQYTKNLWLLFEKTIEDKLIND